MNLLERYINKRRFNIPKLFIQQNSELLSLSNYYNIITYSCDNSDIEALNYVLRNYGIDISTNSNYVFRHSCRNNCLLITKMLYNDTIKQKDLNLAFTWACECGHYDTIMWLYDKGVDIHFNNDYAFKWSCINGHLNIAKWLYSIDNTFMIDDFIENFVHICKHYDIENWFAIIKSMNVY